MKINPLLQNLRLPGETVRLPSKAQFYDNTIVHEDVLKEGELHILPMTTYEEILMKTPDLLYTGQAIIQTFARCIPQVLDPLRMYSKDVDFLLVALRKVTYGQDIPIRYTHNCEDAREHEYLYNVQNFINSTKTIEAAFTPENATFALKNGQTVETRPFLLQDVVDASQRATTMEVEGLSDMEFATTMREIVISGILPAIVKVDETTDREMIQEWLEALPPPLIQELSHKIEAINNFGINMDAKVKCQDCGSEITVNIPLNPQSFFIVPSDLEAAS